MVRSYIGLVTRRGLEALHEENDHVVRFLNRRVCRQRHLGGLCWAVMDDDASEYVQVQIALGEMHAALCSLEIHAEYCGSLSPDLSDPVASFHQAEVSL